MKKIILIFLFLSLWLVSIAQQEAHFSQFFSNKLIQNPAYAGSSEMLNLTALHRQQWIGLKGAPTTQLISLHGPFFKKRVGLGLSILRDDITISENWNIITSYAYRIPLETGTLSFGLQADLKFLKMNWDEVAALHINDNEIPNLNTHNSKSNVAAGLYYQTKKLYVGLAIQNMIPSAKTNSVDGIPQFFANEKRHVYLMGGYAFRLAPKIKFVPIVLMKYVENIPFDMDVNASFIFFDKLLTGVSWRKDDSIDFILQYQISRQIRLGLAYDYTISKLQQVNSGSYEILLQYDLNSDLTKYANIRYF